MQSVLCGDQKIFDYTIYDPQVDEVINPNGYLWMDCSSRMINGVWLEFGHYNSYTVGHSLRGALDWGNPDEIYTDWGKPEGSKHISSILAALNGHSTAGGLDLHGGKIRRIRRSDTPQGPARHPLGKAHRERHEHRRTAPHSEGLTRLPQARYGRLAEQGNPDPSPRPRQARPAHDPRDLCHPRLCGHRRA